MNGVMMQAWLSAGVRLRRAEHGRIPDQRRIGVDEARQHGVVAHEVLAEQKLADAHAVLGALGLGDRAHERLVRIFEMRIDHLEMPLVDRQIDRLAHRAAGMMDERAQIRELDEILEVFERPVAAALVEVVDERRAVVGREHHRVAADHDVALRVARVLHILRRRRRAELPREAARKPHPLALDVAAGVCERDRARGESRETRCRSPAAASRRCVRSSRGLPRSDISVSGIVARDVGDGRMRSLCPRRAARLAAASRLPGGGRCGFRHGVLAFPMFILPLRPDPAPERG